MGGVIFGVVLSYLVVASALYQFKFKKQVACDKCAAVRALTWPYWVWK